jgi:hypothetical protein
MQRPCDVCETPYEAKRATSKYCSDKCRVAASRGAVTKHAEPENVAAAPISSLPEPEDAPGPVETAVLEELTTAERDKTALGQATLALARRVDIGRDTGAGLAALVKQLEATKNSATADVKTESTPLDRARDELAARRARSA